MEAKLPTCYLLSARVFFPSASVAKIWVIRNLRRIQFAVQEEQLYAECGANFRSSNIFCICPSLFETPVLTRQNIAWSTKNSQEFLASQVSVLWEEIKPTTPLLLTVHFLAAMKPLVFVNLFKLFGLDITFAREVCRLGIKMKKIWQSSYSFHYPQWQNACANVMANLSNLNKLPNTRVFVAAENGSVEVLELVALFLLKTETFGAKNW